MRSNRIEGQQHSRITRLFFHVKNPNTAKWGHSQSGGDGPVVPRNAACGPASLAHGAHPSCPFKVAVCRTYNANIIQKRSGSAASNAVSRMDVKQTPKIGAGLAGPGRPKGKPNKATALLKDAILKAAESAGGEGGMAAYLEGQAKDNPGPFMALLGKVLPLQIAGDPENQLGVLFKTVYEKS